MEMNANNVRPEWMPEGWISGGDLSRELAATYNKASTQIQPWLSEKAKRGAKDLIKAGRDNFYSPNEVSRLRALARSKWGQKDSPKEPVANGLLPLPVPADPRLKAFRDAADEGLIGTWREIAEWFSARGLCSSSNHELNAYARQNMDVLLAAGIAVIVSGDRHSHEAKRVVIRRTTPSVAVPAATEHVSNPQIHDLVAVEVKRQLNAAFEIMLASLAQSHATSAVKAEV